MVDAAQVRWPRTASETVRRGVAIDLMEAHVAELLATRDRLQAENTRLVLENRRLAAQIEACPVNCGL